MTESDDVSGVGPDVETGVISSSSSDSYSESGSEDQYDGRAEAEAIEAIAALRLDEETHELKVQDSEAATA